MAGNAEIVKLGADNAAEMTSSLPPVYPPHPQWPHPQSPPPLYATAPPPAYSQTVSNKAYEAMNTSGAYLYAPVQANQPHQMLLPPYPQAGDGQAQQVVLVETGALRRGHPSFLAHFILSCFVFWCCGWMFGGIAFVAALMAQNAAGSGDVTGARRLGYISLALSICGFVIGIIAIVLVFVQAAM